MDPLPRVSNISALKSLGVDTLVPPLDQKIDGGIVSFPLQNC